MNDENTKTCKLVLIGETGEVITYIGVGKTSIIQRFIYNNFKSTLNSTIGATFATKAIKYDEYSKVIKFEVDDTKARFGIQPVKRNIARFLRSFTKVEVILF